MNLDTLKREVFYIVEDELKEQVSLYDGYQDDIYELMTFFLDQNTEINKYTIRIFCKQFPFQMRMSLSLAEIIGD